MGPVRFRVVCSALVAISVVGLSAAGKDVPIRVTVPAGSPLGPAGGIYEDQGTGDGVFETSSGQLVSAELRASINFFLDLGSSRAASPRNLCVAFGPVVGTPVDPTLVPTSPVCTDMHWNTSDSGNLAAMAPSATPVPKRMQVFWEANGGTYYLRWGTSGSVTHDDWVTVTCTAQSAPGTCSQWGVSAIGLVAHLSYSSKRTGLVDVADYQVDVAIDVVRP